MSIPEDPQAAGPVGDTGDDDASDTVTEAPATEGPATEATATETAAPVSHGAGSQAKTVALVASVAAVAGLAGGFAIRAANHRPATSTTVPAGATGGNTVQRGDAADADDAVTGPGVAGRIRPARPGSRAVPAPLRGGGTGSTSSHGS